jgi:two-component system, response regulator PdtaR
VGLEHVLLVRGWLVAEKSEICSLGGTCPRDKMLELRHKKRDDFMNNGNGGPTTILVAEDEVFIRMDTSEWLRSQGFNVLEASNAGEAIQILDSGVTVALLFTDVRMPGALDGLDLVRYVEERYPQTKFLVTSGHMLVGEMPQTWGKLIVKPYSLDFVLNKIREQLRKKEPEGHEYLNRSLS